VQQLRPGRQQGQRGAQLVPGVGDEPALEREGGNQRAQRAEARPGLDCGRREQPDHARDQHGGQDSGAVLLPCRQVEHRLDGHAVGPTDGHHAVVHPADVPDAVCGGRAGCRGGERLGVVGAGGQPGRRHGTVGAGG